MDITYIQVFVKVLSRTVPSINQYGHKGTSCTTDDLHWTLGSLLQMAAHVDRNKDQSCLCSRGQFPRTPIKPDKKGSLLVSGNALGAEAKKRTSMRSEAGPPRYCLSAVKALPKKGISRLQAQQEFSGDSQVPRDSL